MRCAAGGRMHAAGCTQDASAGFTPPWAPNKQAPANRILLCSHVGANQSGRPTTCHTALAPSHRGGMPKAYFQNAGVLEC